MAGMSDEMEALELVDIASLRGAFERMVHNYFKTMAYFAQVRVAGSRSVCSNVRE
jgi:hypothetical protein